MPRKSIHDASPQKLRNTDLKTVRLGSKPFSASVPYYRAYQEPVLSKETISEDVRKLKLFAKFFEDLYDSGGCSTMDPRKITEPMIMEFIMWMKERNLAASTQVSYLKILNRLLILFGNNVIPEMRNGHTYKFPKVNRDTPISALSREELRLVFDTTYNLRGWSGIAFRGLLALSFGTASRPKEVIRARVEDLNLKNAEFYVRHPKGEGTWGIPQAIPIIRLDMVPYLEEFLRDREKILEEYGIESKYLFFNPNNGAPFVEQTMRRLKCKVEDMCGISFKLKDMRSTCASLTVNNNVERLNAVSEQLRHASPDTTRRYYARINRQEAIKKGIGDAWKENEI